MSAPVRPPRPRLTPSAWIAGTHCGHWRYGDRDRCLRPTVGGRDYCPEHSKAVAR